MYHTQEKRRKQLYSPIVCERKNAWLGLGYYFWNEEVDAIHWGNTSKRATGYYEIYKANIECNNVLDTVFNEKHYSFWVKQIEKAASFIIKRTGVTATISEINQYFNDKAKWSDDIDGILFQDLPFSADLLVKELNYRKRIQIAIYNMEIISNFAVHFDMECN